MTCPNSKSQEQYTVKLLPNGILQLQCLKSVKTINYSFIEDCSFPMVSEIEFHGCPLSSVPFGEVVHKVGVQPENITSLKLIGEGQEPGRNLEHWHLQGLSNLKFLEMRENGFTKVPENIFIATPKLKSLKLIGSNLDTVPEFLLSNTPDLTEVDLSNNSFISLPVGLYTNLTKLTNISLQNNSLSEIRSELFRNTLLLDDLDLSNNYITSIQENLFKGLRNMKSLNLHGNKLKSLPGGIFSDMTAIKTIDLSSNLLSDLGLGTFDNLIELETLYLGNNQLSDLPDTAFQKCQSLKKLYLNYNLLEILKSTSFPNPQSMLTDLDLGNNKIASSLQNVSTAEAYYFTENGGFPLTKQTNLINIFLNDNKYENIPHSFNAVFLKLQSVDLSGNMIQEVEVSSLHFLNDSVKLNLKNNNIKLIDMTALDTILSSVEKSKSVDVSLEGNDLMCNCMLYEFARMVQGKRLKEGDFFKIRVMDIDKVSCRNSEGDAQNVLDIDTQMLTCQWEDPCDNCTCYWRPHDKMFIIDCSYQDLKELPTFEVNHYLPANLSYSITLDMRNNSITSLSGLQDPLYSRLVNLTLPNNKLSFINESYFPERLKVLDVRWNNLTSLPESTLEFFNVTDMYLSLGNNPWRCSCGIISFLNFLHVPSRKVDDFDDIRCNNEDESVMNISEHRLCPFFMQPMVVVTIVAILIFLILFAVLGTVSFYKYKQGIKVWLFTHRLCLWAITEDEMDADKKYDAFISYSHKDEEFVNKVLVPGLESGDPKYRVCLHYRDWIPGEYIQNQILQSVEASRRTLVVLSSNFIESVWGQLEFKAAHSQALQDRTNRLIIIVYGKIPSESELDEKLQLYISMKTYVKWGDAKFWEKLRYFMPHPQDLIQKKHRQRKDTDKLELCKSDSKQSVLP